MRRRTHRPVYLTLSVVAIGLLWWSATTEKRWFSGGTRSAEHDRSASFSSGSSLPPRDAKLGIRPESASVSELDRERFHRFHLPPIAFQDADLDSALREITRVYRETARAGGLKALDLQLDTTAAARSRKITLTTPRAPVETVLGIIAAVSGNQLNGPAPRFTLRPLDDPGHRVSREVPLAIQTLIDRLLQSAELPARQHLEHLIHAEFYPQAEVETVIGAPDLPPGAFKEFISEPVPDLTALGFSKEVTASSTPGSAMVLENLNASDEAILKSLERIQAHQPLEQQMKVSTSVLRIPSGVISDIQPDTILRDKDIQHLMRRAAETQGVVLTQMPSVTSRPGHPATISIINDAGDDTYNGTVVAVAAVPLGLGHEHLLVYQERDSMAGSDGTTSVISRSATITGGRFSMTHTTDADGGTLLVISRLEAIDSTGRPLAGN